MLNLNEIKGIIFDYGGTIDSNGKHWAEVLWESYQKFNVPVTKEQFREAYVYGERYLATNHVIEPNYNFKQLLYAKVNLQIDYLLNLHCLKEKSSYVEVISEDCYTFASDLIKTEIPLLEELKSKYPLVLVSNFYGNVQAVLKDFGLDRFFNDIIESAVVGVRKPDPKIFALGVESLNLESNEVVVIGDSYDKDIVPAVKNGCSTVWLKGLGWGNDPEDISAADCIIADFKELKTVFHLQ